MKKEWQLSQATFDRLLHWLDPEPTQAGAKYERIRHKLVKIFVYRGSNIPEDLADETINRVAERNEISAKIAKIDDRLNRAPQYSPQAPPPPGQGDDLPPPPPPPLPPPPPPSGASLDAPFHITLAQF